MATEHNQAEPMDISPQPSTFPPDQNRPITGYPPSNLLFSQPHQGMNLYTQAMSSQFLVSPSLCSAAAHYGAKIGKDVVDEEMGKFVTPHKLKSYFAVDTSYVLHKLKLLIFPFTHRDWSQKFYKEQILQPRQNVNRPDLYIPSMAFITYLLMAGLILGTQDRGTPEKLGIIASQALAWMILSVVLQLIALYVMNIQTILITLDLVALACYIFVNTILMLTSGWIAGRIGFYVSWLYLGLAFAFFLVRTMKWMLMVENVNNFDSGYNIPSSNVSFNLGNKRRLYFLMSVALVQPFVMWILTYDLKPF